MRHAIRAAIRPALTILVVVCALSCGPKSVKTEFSPALVDNQGRLSLGGFEHRGERYELWDLMDAGFRAGHDDPFVREFSPNTILTRDFIGIVHHIETASSGVITLYDSTAGLYEDHTTQQCLETQSEE